MIYIDLFTTSGKRVRVECRTYAEVITMARIVWDALEYLEEWRSARP